MTDLSPLITALEKAEGPSRELDYVTVRTIDGTFRLTRAEFDACNEVRRWFREPPLYPLEAARTEDKDA